MNEKTTVTFRIDPELAHQFKVYCASWEITQQDAIAEMMQEWLEYRKPNNLGLANIKGMNA